jgi:hypothetical protein
MTKKIIMVTFMIIGIGFSISNFVTTELESKSAIDGSWLYNEGDWVCIAPGTECSTSLNGISVN